MRARTFALLLTVASSTLARAQGAAAVAPLPSVDLPPALERVLRDYERAWQARDPAALAALFAEDGFVLANGEPPVRGRARVRGAYKDGGGPLSLRALAYATEGPVGYIIGAYGPRAGEKDTGKFILALRREKDGRWSIAADMDNASRHRPPSPAPAPPQD